MNKTDKELRFLDWEEFEKTLSREIKKKAKALYRKYYEIPYGDKEPIFIVSKPEDGEDYLKTVNLEDFK